MKIVNQFDGLNPVNSLILMASFVGINENFMYNVCQKFFNEINKQEVVRNRTRYKRDKVSRFLFGNR